MWTWGKVSYGVLGHNNQTGYSSPKQVPGTTWNEVVGQQQGMTATKTDGTLWTWGQNSDGQLGQNEGSLFYTHMSSPTQVGGDTDWNKPVASLSKSGAAIKTDGTLWTWGDNNKGKLGQNNQTDYSSPVQVPGNTWSHAAFGSGVFIANKTDGTLWSWGYGLKGTLGQNESPGEISYSSPVQIGTGTDWAYGNGSVSSSSYVSAAVKTDGTLWTWGKNDDGQLGHNNKTEYSSPKQIPGTWSSVFCGWKSTFATKTDGTLWSWGYGSRSNRALLGQNNTTSRSSPVQVGSETDWSANLGGSYFAIFGMRMN